MDFLDPKKMRQQNIMLLVGYGLSAIAILIATMVLLYQSNGFGVNRKGQVIQNGLVFTASTPKGAAIYIDGQNSQFQTNKRVLLPAAHYVFQYQKDGYREWTQSVNLNGGAVVRLDYAFLFPKILDTALAKKYDAAPRLMTQSPDRRWVLTQTADDIHNFDVYDLKNPTDPPTKISLPSAILTDGAAQSWMPVEWSNDNRHVVLKHTYDGSAEYILLDRSSPDQSLNLDTTLNMKPTEINLVNKKYDQYYVYSAANALLQRASLSSPTPVDYLKNVLAYKSYGDDTMLYVTDDVKAESGAQPQVAAKLAVGDQTYTIRRMMPGSQYLLEIAQYSGDMYVLAGSNAENKVVVYKNPIDQITNKLLGVAVQVSTLHVNNPNYVSFSNSARFMMTENGSQFSVYDAELDKTYTYSFTRQLDAPQLHADWMDGNRLTYVSSGALFEFDADQTNRQTLMAANPAYEPAFTPDYTQVFTLSPQRDDPAQLRMASTWLLAPADR